MINRAKAKAQGVTGVKYTKSPEQAEMINLEEKKNTVMGTSLKSSTPKGAVRISLRAKLVRVLPKSARSDRELATLQSTRNEPSTATVRGGRNPREDCSR